MPALPTGTVTYLFTDVEGSTRLWEQSPEGIVTLRLGPFQPPHSGRMWAGWGREAAYSGPSPARRPHFPTSVSLVRA